MNWIDTFLHETDFVETPKQWLTWSALCTISAIISPNIRIDKQAYKLRPNLFVLLAGRSGLGKGFGPSLSRRLVKRVGTTRVISGRGSIEGIISELAISRSSENGKVPFKDARGYLCSGEFASSLYEAKHALTILTDLYDAHDNEEWTNTLKNSPIEKLRFPCLTLLSGANQDMFDLVVDKHHLGGGFVGRTLLIPADKRYKANPLIDEEESNINEASLERLTKYLIEISTLSGFMKWSIDAKKVYKEWFFPYRNADIDDKTGTADRLNDHVIKVATCISVARKPDMILEEEDILDAIDLCVPLVGAAKKVAGMQGKSSLAGQVKSFLILIFNSEKYEMTRKQILQRGFGDFDSAELDKVVETLSQTGFITSATGGKDTRYKVTEAGINWWVKQTSKT